MDDIIGFKARQIVCLEYQSTHLYAEVIQVVESRQVGWVRPLLLAEFPANSSQLGEPLLFDLRLSADLLWPLASIRPALDMEVMSFLLQLLASEPPLDRDPVALTHFHQFICQAWQAQQPKTEG